MHYSKDYYTKAKERIDKLQKEFTDHNTPFSNSDDLQKAGKNDPGFEKIMTRIRKMEQQTMHVVNPEKLTSFFQLMDLAKELAKYCEMNIDIRTSKSLYGVLKLQSGYIMMNKDTDIRIREILNELTLKSEQFSIAALEGTFEMEYWFDLFDVIEKNCPHKRMQFSLLHPFAFQWSFASFLYVMICPGWQFNRRHKLQITSQVTFSFRISFAIVLECIPLFLSHCLFTFLRFIKIHKLEKSIYPFSP